MSAHRRILVIDDTEAIVDVIRDLLTDEGYNVLTPSMPFPDLGAIVNAKPDLIILDYLFGMEPMGELLVRQVRSCRATATIPIVLCTAATLPADLHEDFQFWQVEILPKPFAVDELLECVTQLLDMSRIAAMLPGQSRQAAHVATSIVNDDSQLRPPVGA